MSQVFKTLGSNDVTIRPFKVHKTQIITFTSGSGSNPPFEMNIALGVAPVNIVDFDPNISAKNDNGSYPEPLYSTVKHTFYTSGSISGSSMNFAAGGDPIRNFPLGDEIYVLNIAQPTYGEGIRRGTFVLSAPAAGTGTFVDDGKGRLQISGSDPSSSVAGNIFYNLGVAVINKIDSASVSGELIQDTGMFIDNGDAIRTQFNASHTIYEYQVMARMNPLEFNYPLNQTAYSSTDVSGSKFLDSVASGSSSPYFTTIGLYNDRYELLAVGKLPRPIKRLVKSEQSIVVRFDV